MTNNEIKSFLLKNPIYLRENFFVRKFPETYDALLKCEFPDEFSFAMKLYHYLNNDLELKSCICPTCGRMKRSSSFKSFGQGYREFCSKKCIYTEERSEKCRNTKMERYGNPNYNNPEKNRRTCRRKYGVDNVSQSEHVKRIKLEKVLNRTDDEKMHFRNSYKDTWDRKPEDEKLAHISRIEETKTKLYNDPHYSNPDKTKKTKLNRHGSPNYVNTDKMKETKLRKHGDPNYVNPEKAKVTKILRYGDANYVNTGKIKETKRKVYGDANYNNRKKFIGTIHSEEYVIRQKEKYDNVLKMYRERGVKCAGGVSATEIVIYDCLVGMFGSDDVLTQYSSKKYPYRCDFYIKSLDLYIEVNAHWTHGGHPFDCNNADDVKKLRLWKSESGRFYKSAVNTWTVRDVEKRETAKSNNLNYLEIFSCDFDEIKKTVLEYAGC